jgi:hypothetical protein
MEKINLKLTISSLFIFCCLGISSAQSFNGGDKTVFSNFVKRMYSSSPFEGVKIIDDYDHQYLISVISLEKAKYTSESTMNRVAQVKAQSQANIFINGSNITMDIVIRTSETKDSIDTKTIVESVETIKENASGFTQGMELLSNFDNQDNLRKVFVYFREMKKED